MKTTDELQHDIEQFDFRCVRETKVRRERNGRLTIMHLPTRSTRQHSEIARFRTFAEENWTIREIEHAASFHPAGVFHPHEDAEARITRTKIENTKDDCLVEEPLDPSAIICLGKPFDEMRGNVVPVKYEIFRREGR